MSDKAIKTVFLNFNQEGFIEEADKLVSLYVDELNATMKRSNNSSMAMFAAQIALELMAQQGRSMRELVGVDPEAFSAACQRYSLGFRK